MLIIEFFGPSGSGKTFFKNKFLKKYFKSYKIYNYKNINYILNSENFFIKLYFNFIKSKFIKETKKILKINTTQIKLLNYFFKNYQNKFSTNNLKSNEINKLKYISKLIYNSNFNNSEKKNFIRWSKEEILGYNLAKGYKRSDSLLIDSEGLLQRLFIYCYKKKNKKKIIKQYLDIVDLPDILIFFNKIQYKKKINVNISKKEIKVIYLLTLNYLKKKKILLLNSEQNMDIIYKRINHKILKLR